MLPKITKENKSPTDTQKNKKYKNNKAKVVNILFSNNQ